MLDELVNTIKELQERIREQGDVLRASEAQTRMSLIDPLLRALGWNTASPAQVRPEFWVGGRRADYALLNAQGDVVVFLEAKSLGEPLAGHRSQVTGYANELGLQYPALTNGSEWEVYDNFQPKPIEQRRILSISLANDDPAKAALQLLLLWRPNMESGVPIAAAEPIVGVSESASTTTGPEQTTNQGVADTPGSEWISLREFGLLPRETQNSYSVIRFPTGEEKQMPRWVDLLIGVAEWLIRDGALAPAKSPIADRIYPSLFIVNSQPRHSEGRDFSRKYELPEGLFLYTHGRAKTYMDRCITLLEECGKDPATVHVKAG